MSSHLSLNHRAPASCIWAVILLAIGGTSFAQFGAAEIQIKGLFERLVLTQEEGGPASADAPAMVDFLAWHGIKSNAVTCPARQSGAATASPPARVASAGRMSSAE